MGVMLGIMIRSSERGRGVEGWGSVGESGLRWRRLCKVVNRRFTVVGLYLT